MDFKNWKHLAICVLVVVVGVVIAQVTINKVPAIKKLTA